MATRATKTGGLRMGGGVGISAADGGDGSNVDAPLLLRFGAGNGHVPEGGALIYQLLPTKYRDPRVAEEVFTLTYRKETYVMVQIWL